MRVIDADGLILGRLASMTARALLKGETIVIVNAEKSVISGRKAYTFQRYKQYYDRGSREKGPYFPRMPERILKRTIRGMLPYKKQRGREALARLRVYRGLPAEFEGVEKESLEDASIHRLSTANYSTLGEVSRKLGANF